MAIGALLPLFLGGLGIRQSIISSNRDEQREFDAQQRSLLGQGVQDALGQAPGIFDAPLFPGEQQIPGLQTAGSGLLADPNNQTNQLQFAGNIFGLPGGAQAGQSFIEQSLRFGQQRSQQQNLFGQQDAAQQNQFDFTAQQNLLSREQDQQQFQQKFAEKQRMDNLAISGRGDPSLGPIPSSTRRMETSPGQFTDIPMPNNPRYIAAQKEILDNEDAVFAIQDLIDEVTGEGGFETFGVGAGKQKVLFEKMVSLAQKEFTKGALQGEERTEIVNALRDPTDFWRFATTDAEVVEGYKTLRKLLQRRLKGKNKLYNAWGLGSKFDKTTPSQLRKLEKRRVAEEKAAALGLTLTPVPLEAPTKEDTLGVKLTKDAALTAAFPPLGMLRTAQTLFNEVTR